MTRITRQLIHKALAPIKPFQFLKGYHQLVLILELCIENWDSNNDLKSIYIKVAELCHCNPCSIERNIRTMLFSIDYQKLSDMVGYEVSVVPSTKDFVEILITYIVRDFLANT